MAALLGLFVAAGLPPLVAVGVRYGPGGGGLVLTSPDGRIWTSRSPGTTNPFTGVAWGRHTFVAVGYGGIGTSPDGAAWTQLHLNPDLTVQLRGVTFADNMFLGVGNPGVILSSPDGAVWTRHHASGLTNLAGVAYGRNTFVAVGQSGTIVQSGVMPAPGQQVTSTEGQVWRPGPGIFTMAGVVLLFAVAALLYLLVRSRCGNWK